MLPEEIDRLRQLWSGKHVTVDPQRPELARMLGKRGKVVTINFNGRALVQFEGPDQGWYDIHPDFLRVLEQPAAE